MGDYKYLVQQFQSQESARWKNKIESNRLENEISGKGGIEYERAFHMKTIDNERRRIENELGSIRRPRKRRDYRRASKPEVLMTSLNPPLTKSDIEKSPLVFPGRRRHTLNGFYDQPLIPGTQEYKERKIKNNPVQTTTHEHTRKPVNTEPAALNKTENVQGHASTEIVGGEENPLSNPVLYQRRHMVQFVDESHLTHNKGKSSKFGPGSIIYYPTANPNDPDHSPQWIRQYKPANEHTHLADLNVSTAKENVVKRLTDTGNTNSVNATQKIDSGDSGDKSTGNTGKQYTVNETEESEMATNKGILKKPGSDSKDQRGSKSSNSEDMLKGSKFDGDMYNPDGSLRTKHQLPSFEDAYEQARKARYIRSKERSDLDRELEITEVFQHNEKTTEAAQ